jgi:hypothetical protein
MHKEGRSDFNRADLSNIAAQGLLRPPRGCPLLDDAYMYRSQTLHSGAASKECLLQLPIHLN